MLNQEQLRQLAHTNSFFNCSQSILERAFSNKKRSPSNKRNRIFSQPLYSPMQSLTITEPTKPKALAETMKFEQSRVIREFENTPKKIGLDHFADVRSIAIETKSHIHRPADPHRPFTPSELRAMINKVPAHKNNHRHAF